MNLLLNLTLLSMILSAVAYSISAHRQLIAEGAWFFFRILHFEDTSFGNNHLRYLATLWEVPVWTLRQATKNAPQDLTALYLMVWKICQFLPFFLGLWLCYLILQKAKRIQVFPVILTIYAMVVLPHFVFNSNPIGEVHALLWPLFLFVMLFGEKVSLQAENRMFLFSLIGLVTPLCLSHELAGGLLLLVAGVLFLKHLSEKTLRKILLCSGVLLVAALSNFVRIALGKYTTGEGLIRWTLDTFPHFKFHFFLIFGFTCAITLAAFPVKNFYQRLSQGLMGISALSYLGWLFNQQSLSILNMHLWQFRLLSSLLTGILALLVLIILIRKVEFPLRTVALSCLAATFCMMLADMVVTHQWKTGRQAYLNYLRDLGPGCHLVPFKNYQERVHSFGLPAVYSPMYSFTLPISRDLRTIIFAINPEDTIGVVGEDACQLVQTGKFYFFGVINMLPSPYLVNKLPQ